MSERGGVEIDYCPECRGVWLDRGELDKILDRAEKEFAAAAPAPAPAAPVILAAPQQQQQQYPAQNQRSPQYGERSDREYNDRDRDRRDGYRPKKRENWLGELFG